MRDKFDEIGFLWAEQALKDDDQLLIMRDVKLGKNNKKVKYSVPVPDYPLKELHLSNLRKINKALLSHCFTLAVSDDDLLKVNTKKPDEVDFSGFGIRILYSMAGAKYEGKDPYDLKLKAWKGKGDPRRKKIKKAFNALINDIDGTFKLSPKQITLLGMNTKALEERIKVIHKPIADLLRTRDGLRATYIDSTIAEHIMLTMINDDAITLTWSTYFGQPS
ncbi:hypothetical protein [Glaciecola sp. HTCC2999]|uniref:hypothetical protein n=1 Tax=Glaciecola sp. HTCC2999 TaxID=455436 RepID=UPI0000E0F7E9|nr:hypothetical protein [Glaciecola sp. HTCC2999]